MGNAILGGSKRRTAMIMNINGETTKVKTPIQAMEITDKHPAGHVLLESEAVKQYGIRAKALEPRQYLEPRRVYFLVELPKAPAERSNQQPRRVRSGGIQISAKDRLESLMLSRRTVSDLSAMRVGDRDGDGDGDDGGAMRVRMRLPRSKVERLIKQSKNEAEAAHRIMDLCSNPHIIPLADGPPYTNINNNKKRVGFLPVTDDEIRLAVAS